MPSYFDERYMLTHRLQGLANGLEVEIAKNLETAMERVSGKLASLEAKAKKTTSFTRQKQFLVRQQKAIAGVLDDVYADIGKWIKDQSVKLALEAPAMQAALFKSLGVEIVATHLKKARVVSYFESFEVESLTFNQWLSKLEQSTAQRIVQATRQSYLAGETRAEAAKCLQGALDISRQSAMGLTQNSFNQMYNWAELENFKVNKVKRVRWVAELDKQTCPQCIPLDGKVYSIDELPVVPPIHWRCRCFLDPVTLSDKLSADYSTRPARIELEGSKELDVQHLTRNKTYSQWMQSMATSKNAKHAAFAREAMGKTRFDLVRSGKLSVNKLYYKQRLRTIEELKRLI